MTIWEILDEAGIEAEERNPQFNLTHASIHKFGVRAGLDRRIVPILQREFPENFTPEALEKQHMDFVNAIANALIGSRSTP